MLLRIRRVEDLPFCNNCGKYEIFVDVRKLCQNCAEGMISGQINEKVIQEQRRLIHNNRNLKLLYYPTLVNSIQSDNENLTFLTEYGRNSTTLASELSQRLAIAQNPLRGGNNPNLVSPRTRLALISSILGWILLLIPVINVLSIFVQMFGLIMAIQARRQEPHHWHQILAIILILGFWIFLIVGTAVILSDPEFMAELEALLNQQMV